MRDWLRFVRPARLAVLSPALVASLVLVGVAAALTPQPPGEGTAQTERAAELVARALAAEADGDLDRRTAYLQEALDVDPDYAPLHWQLGEVRVGQKWLSVDTASQACTAAGTVTKYRELRDEAKATVEDQLRLAQWCDRHDLKVEQRAHLAKALDLSPTRKQAHAAVAKLGLVRYQGRLMAPAEAETLKQQARRADADLKSWTPRLTRWRHDLESRNPALREAAEQQMRALNDVGAVPALEAVFARSKPDVAVVAIRTLSTMPEQPATDSLLRTAVMPDDDAIRRAAAEALHARDIFAYAPQLIDSLVRPLEVSFEQSSDLAGGFRERLQLFREGPRYNLSFVSNHIVPGTAQLLAPTAGRPNRVANALLESTRVIGEAGQDAQLAAAAQVENKLTEARNERVAAALQTATGIELPADPKVWWQWWDDFNELHYPQNKPTYQQVRTVTPRASHSCFVPGTLVWTNTGTLPIEKIRVGDAVLSQDIETGELTYKPVAAITAGPPLDLVELHAGTETIRCTQGHLFWVAGQGWQMAKELKAGQQLYTARGPLLLEGVEQRGQAGCHNLIVADFNTYFVTDQQILVHDINVRKPTRATVPGMTPQ